MKQNNNSFILKRQKAFRKSLVIAACLGLSFTTAQAQEEYAPLEISSGFNQDVIAENSPALDYTTASIDGTSATTNYAFMSLDFPGATVGLPSGGVINSEATEDLQLKLADYSANNVLKLVNTDDTGALELATPQSTQKLYVFGTSGSGDSYFTGTIYFTDNTTQAIVAHLFPDWYQSSPAVGVTTSGIGRVSRADDGVDNNTTNPKIFQFSVDIDEANQGKAIEKVEFTKTADGTGILNIFGISAVITPDCPKPYDLAASSITSETADISWVSSGAETEWTVIYGESGFSPAAGEGTVIADLTTVETTLSGLEQNTSYDVYVKANCSDTETSNLEGPLTFTTACGATTIPFLQDFEAIAPPALPNCASLETINGGDWKTASNSYSLPDDFEGNVLEHSYSGAGQGSVDAWYFTQGITLEAGLNYQITFKYGNNSSTYIEQLKVAYGTSAAAADMTNQIVDLTTISGAQANDAEYNFTVSADGVYYFGFQSHSDENQYYLYVDDISVHLAPTCLNPTAVTVSNIAETTADLSWTAGEAETQWEVVYGEAGFDMTTTGDTLSVQTTPELSLTGLTQNTSYDVYVRAICSETDQSTWEGPLTFTTACGIANIPFSLDFENVETPNLPACSSLETISGNDWKTTGGVSGFDSNVLNYSYNSTQDADTWFFTQGINLEAGVTYRISYKYGNSGNYAEQLKVAFGSEAASTAMTNDLSDHTNILSTSTNLVYFSVDTDGVYYFGFQAHSDANENQLYVDDILIEVAPTCITPEGLQVSNMTTDQAEVTWTSNGDETSWELIYGETGFDPATAGETVVVNDTPETTLTGLNSGMSYDIYVRAVCSDTDQSAWSDPTSFATLCEATSLPFTQDFNSTANEEVPTCATLVNAGNGNNWTVYDPTTGWVTADGFDGNVLSYEYNLNEAANAWYFTQGVELEAGVNYKISYKYGNGSTSEAVEKLKVAFGDAPTVENMTTTLADHPEISGVSAESNAIIFTVETAGVYYFGFNAYSDANKYYLFIDDITVEVGPTCPQPSDIALNYITDQSVTVSWQSLDDATSWVVKYGEAGFDPATAGTTIEVSEAMTTEITGLSSETTYDVYVQSLCGAEDQSEWAGPVSFTTLVTPPANTYLCDAIELAANAACANGPYTNVHAFEEPNEPSGSCLNDFHGTNSVWFYFVATANTAIITTDFASTDFNTEISVFAAPTDCADLTTLGEEIGCASAGSDAELSGLVIGETYYVKITGFNNAEGNFCIEVQMELGVEKQMFDAFTYYPNPVEGQLNLKAAKQIESVVIYDLLGHQVKTFAPNHLNAQLQLDDLQAGMYLMKVSIDGQSKTFRVVKK